MEGAGGGPRRVTPSRSRLSGARHAGAAAGGAGKGRERVAGDRPDVGGPRTAAAGLGAGRAQTPAAPDSRRRRYRSCCWKGSRRWAAEAQMAGRAPDIRIALALWRSGALALWRSGALALWRSGALALWRSGALALWRSGALALWRFILHPAGSRPSANPPTGGVPPRDAAGTAAAPRRARASSDPAAPPNVPCCNASCKPHAPLASNPCAARRIAARGTWRTMPISSPVARPGRNILFLWRNAGLR